MAASKSGFMKDALILFAITLISGVCLGFVYDITKAPIERATIEANNRTYKEVLSTAAEFSEVEGSAEKIAALTESGELEGLATAALPSSPSLKERTRAEPSPAMSSTPFPTTATEEP